MKLLIFCPYYPPHVGGLESHADEFNKYLSQRGVDITVFTPRLPKDSLEKETKYDNVKIIRFPAFEIIPNYPLPKFWKASFWQLFFALFKENFDITISRTRFFFTSILALIYAKIKNIRWIHIEHGSDFVQLSSTFKTIVAKLYDYTFGFIIFKFSDQNISISQAVQKFVYKFDKRDSPVIYRGLDTEEIDKIQPDQKLKDKLAGKIIISFVGRLYKWKGIENSIKAVSSLPEELKAKVVFLIIGDGEDSTYLKEISRNENCIQLLGNLPREKALGILKISDIYLHSAHPGGGLSTSLLEAIYCNCVAIATPNEGADEIIENNKNGFLIENLDSKLIAKKLQVVLESKISFSAEGQTILREKFNWDNNINNYIEIL